ncbi:hypothetical protein LCGC14_1458540 [marine sediment metagenome]|uniref:Uncharacterized protein n=1 Tax=marine sediment metagenome TaxID=412755 RepID=A0A0F9MHQ3_9ZZZZ
MNNNNNNNNSIPNQIQIRKHKRKLYEYLLNHGFDNLSATEKEIVMQLGKDEDIQRLLIGGHIFRNKNNG